MSVPFYCRNPRDWMEGANMGHLMSIAFASEIDSGAERIIAKHLHDEDLEFEDLLFSGRVMKFLMGGRGRVFLDNVEDLADSLHSDLPITDVVFHGMRDGEPGFEEAPIAAAAMNPGLPFSRPVDESAPGWHPGTAFGEEMQRLFRASSEKEEEEEEDEYVRGARKALEKARAKQKDGPVQIQPKKRPDVGSPDVPVFRPQEPSPGKGYPGRGDRPIATGARPIAQVFDGESTFAFRLAVSEGTKRLEFHIGLPLVHVSVSPDGAFAFFASQTFLGRVDLANGDITPLPTPNAHEGLKGVVSLADGHWAALTGVALYIFDETNTLVALKKFKGDKVMAFAEGYGIGLWTRSAFSAFRFVHGKLKLLVKFGYAPAPFREIEDTLYFKSRAGDLAMVGAHAEIAAERASKPRKKKAKELSCDFLSWSLAPGVEAPPSSPVDLPPELTAAESARSPSGEWVAFQDSSGLSVLHAPSSEVTPALPKCAQFFINDEGRLVAIGFNQVMWRHKPAQPAREWPGARQSLDYPGRGSYLARHDLLFFFYETGRAPTVFACDENIYTLTPLPGLRDAFERDGDAYLQWDGLTMRVEGLRELASKLRA